jgi:two-component system sensor histidine kinase QseC
LALLDTQLKETATVLVGSELANLKLSEIARAEDILSDELGEEQIGKFFVLRGKNNDILYESTSSKLLPIEEVPQSPKWVTIKAKGQYIRALNISIPQKIGRTLQVGAIIEQEILSPSYWTKNTFIYILSNLLIGLFVSFFLTSILLKPLTKLSDFFKQITSKEESHSMLPNLPKNLFHAINISIKDEYSLLLKNLDTLIDRINRGYKISRFWSFQMAHELKTPLAILETDVEIASRENKISDKFADEIRSSIADVSNTISTFLSWAEIENIQAIDSNYIVNVANVASDVVKKLSKKYPNRIREDFKSNLEVQCIPQHIELLIQNLVVNALKYTVGEVVIGIDKNCILISDSGKGISQKVREHIGEPFNVDKSSDPNHRGSGLGLAFIYSICNLYGWDISLDSSFEGTVFVIKVQEKKEKHEKEFVI